LIKIPFQNSLYLFVLAILSAFLSGILYQYEIYDKEIAGSFGLSQKKPELIKNIKLNKADNPFRFVAMCNYRQGKYDEVPIRVIINTHDKQILDRDLFPGYFGVGGTRQGEYIITFYNYGKFRIHSDGIYRVSVSLISRIDNFKEFRVNINKSSNSIYIFFHIIAVIFFFFSIFYRRKVFTKGILRIVPYFFLLLIGIFPLLLYFV
jgi:hypothetical protein